MLLNKAIKLGLFNKWGWLHGTHPMFLLHSTLPHRSEEPQSCDSAPDGAGELCRTAQPVRLRRHSPRQSSSFCFHFILFLILALSTKEVLPVFGMNAGRNGGQALSSFVASSSGVSISASLWCWLNVFILPSCKYLLLFSPFFFLTPAPWHQLLALELCWAPPETCTHAAELCLPSAPSASDAELRAQLLSAAFKIGFCIP